MNLKELKQKRDEYKKDGFIPTLDLLIEDLEKENEENIYQQLHKYLIRENVWQSDLIQDDEGWFYYSESDTGHPTDEGYGFNLKKVRLPDKFNNVL